MTIPVMIVIWMAAAIGCTLPAFLWHVRYFAHPGPEYYRLFLASVALLAVVLPGYQRLRRRWLWRYEPVALPLGAVVVLAFYEWKATLVCASVFVACFAAGRWIGRQLQFKTRGPLEEIVISAGIGFGLLECALFALGLMHGYYAWVFVALLAGVCLFAHADVMALWTAIRGLGRACASAPEIASPLGGLVVAFAAVSLLTSAMVILAPAVAFDVLKMHLPEAHFYASEHALRPMPFLRFSYFPQGVETLMTLGFVLDGQPAAQMIPPIFFGLVFLMALYIGRECGASRLAALTGAMAATSIPFLHWTGSVAKNDLALTFFLLAALACYLRWQDSGDFRWIQLGVFFLAIGAGVKHTVLFGAVPLAALFGYAVWRQPARWRAAGGLVALFAIVGLIWHVRTWALTGDPLYPATLRRTVMLASTHAGASKAIRLVLLPWTAHFEGTRCFESPSQNPLGVFLVIFGPLYFLVRQSISRAERICLIFAVIYLVYWGVTVTAVRYAIAPILLLALLTGKRVGELYAGGSRWMRASILAAAAYSFLFALCVAMIMEINAPQLRFFAGRLGRAGYLREALISFPSLEFLSTQARKGDLVLSAANCSTAYAPDPGRFFCILEQKPTKAADVRMALESAPFRFLILRSGAEGLNLAQIPEVQKNFERLYGDAFFEVYRRLGR